MNRHFHDTQHRFTAYLRDPDSHPAPADIESRRLKIYCDLFYNNMESFLAQGFPVLHKLLEEKGLWHPLVRQFFASHACRSPHFVDIPGEFVSYLSTPDVATTVSATDGKLSPWPPYLAELAHYEWLEMVLDTSQDNPHEGSIDPNGDLIDGCPVLNPVRRMVQYQWPVTTIGPGHEPEQALSAPLHLLLFRNRAGQVRFIQINPATGLLVEQLAGDPALTGEQHLLALANKLPGVELPQIFHFGTDLLENFRQRELILGALLNPATK